MAKQGRPRGGCLLRLLGVAAAAVVIAVPVGLLLPDTVVHAVLTQVFPAAGLDLADPQLVASWRWILGSASGLLAAVLLTALVAVARLLTRRPAPPPDAVERLRAANAQGDGDAIRQAADEIGVAAGDEAVEPLLDALKVGYDEPTRQALAAALYRVGRAVTAEVAAPPRRR